MPWYYLPISSSVFLSFLLLSLSPAELFSLCQRILRCGNHVTIWVAVSSPWLGSHHALQMYSGFCSSHCLCRKCSEVSYCISSQGPGSFFESSAVKLQLSRAQRKVDKMSVRISLTLEASEMLLSLHMIFSLERAAAVCAILESILGFDPSLEMIALGYLKFSTASSLWPFILTAL